MKTIVRNDNNVSLYLFPNDTVITQDSDRTFIGTDPVELYILDCNLNNTTVYKDLTEPSEWLGWKYLYTSKDGWVLNENWPPAEPEE